MTRIGRPDVTLSALNEERDHLSIQLSLAAHAETPDPARLSALREELHRVERQILKYRS